MESAWKSSRVDVHPPGKASMGSHQSFDEMKDDPMHGGGTTVCVGGVVLASRTGSASADGVAHGFAHSRGQNEIGKIGYFFSICSPKMLVFGTERVASLVDLMVIPMAGPKRPLDASTNLVDLRPHKVACHQGGRAIFHMCLRRFCLPR